MNACERLLDELDEAVSGRLPDELRAHLVECAACQQVVERHRALRDTATLVAEAQAPEELKVRLKAMPRFPAACERMVERLGDALDGELSGSETREFLVHVQTCAACRGTWEAMATLREVGRLTAPPPRLHASLAIPPRHRIAVRRKRGLFDLRLATAAAYLLAVLTVFLVGNPAVLATRGSAEMQKAALYARAAVENRIESYSRRVKEGVVAAEGWLEDKARDTWTQLQQLFGRDEENRASERNV
jgi:anti-sigma factor RsiW